MSLRRIYSCTVTIMLVSSALFSGAQARFLQVDPIGYKDQVNLYEYVNNDPVDNRDPSGEKCVGEVGHQTCTFDAIRLDGGPKLTTTELAAVRKFEARYTRDVNKLSTSDRSTTVSVKGQPSFKITAKEVGASLATRILTYAPRGSSGNAAAITGGSVFKPSTVVFAAALNQSAKLTDTFIGHEGIHETVSAVSATAPPFLAVEPGRTDHQKPYNDAADALLKP